MVAREYPPYTVGGAGVHTSRLSKALQNVGIEVQVIAFGNPSASSGFVKFVQPKSAIIARTAESPGRELAVLYDIARYRQIVTKFLAKNEFDIIHVQEPYVGGFLKVKNKITTIHDTSYGELRSMTNNEIGLPEVRKTMFYLTTGFIAEYASLATSRAIITPAPNITDELMSKYRLGATKLVTIMNGVAENPYLSISKDKAKRMLGIDPDRTLIFTSARHVARKRLDVLIAAASLLQKWGCLDKAELRIGGDGPLKPSLTRLAEEFGLDEKVKFVGWTSDDELNLYLRASDIFVLCSDYEASPIAALEAMASNTAVISTNILAYPVPSYTRDGVEILTVPPRDRSALATAIRKLLMDREYRESIAMKGAQFAARYTWRNVAQKTIRVYEACLRE